jgi:hypothetical protein
MALVPAAAAEARAQQLFLPAVTAAAALAKMLAPQGPQLPGRLALLQPRLETAAVVE